MLGSGIFLHTFYSLTVVLQVAMAEIAGLVATAITFTSACAVGSHSRRLSRSLRRALVNSRFIDKDIRWKATRFRVSGKAITIACDSLRSMQADQRQSQILQDLTLVESTLR